MKELPILPIHSTPPPPPHILRAANKIFADISIDGNVEVLDLLVKHGANIDATDAEYPNSMLVFYF